MIHQPLNTQTSTFHSSNKQIHFFIIHYIHISSKLQECLDTINMTIHTRQEDGSFTTVGSWIKKIVILVLQ